jgi:osmotically-inducible protein OsmY
MDTKTQLRPDIDIEEDIREFIRGYPPLRQATPHLEFHSKEGVVTLSSHVRSVQAKRVLIDNVPDIAGVTQVDSTRLYDDESIRLDLGRVLPRGVMVRVNFGHITVYGELPANEDADVIVAHIKAVPGVRKVDPQFNL